MSVTIVDVMRRLAIFADVADKRGHWNSSDDSVVTEWVTMSGSRELKATLTVGDCRTAREFIRRIEVSKNKTQQELALVPKQALDNKPAFGD